MTDHLLYDGRPILTKSYTLTRSQHDDRPVQTKKIGAHNHALSQYDDRPLLTKKTAYTKCTVDRPVLTKVTKKISAQSR